MNQHTPPAGGLPPANLGEQFGTASPRSRGLGGILRAVTTTEAPPAEPAAPPEAAPESTSHRSTEPSSRTAEPTPDANADKRTGGRTDPAAAEETHGAAPKASGASAGGSRQLIVYLSPELRTRLRRAAVESSQLDVVLDAIEQAERAGILGQLVTAERSPTAGSGLFERRRPRGAEPHIQVNLYARQSHVDVIDRLVARYDASGRSALVRAALDHALPGGVRKP